MAKKDPMFNKKAIGAYHDRDASFLRPGVPYEKQNPRHDVYSDVDKNQDVNGGFSGGIKYGTD